MRRHLAPAATAGLSLLLVLSGCSEPEAPEPTATPSGSTVPTTGTTSATAPGTELRFGDSAVLAWRATQEVAGELELTVRSVAEQRQSVFDGWVRDDATAGSRPYFVEVTVTNVGDSDLGGQDVPLYLRDNRGTLGAPWTIEGDFAACRSGPLPAAFASGARARMCLVYLVPGGGRVRDLVFEPTEGYDPITWTGDVLEPRRQTGARRAREGRGDRRQRG